MNFNVDPNPSEKSQHMGEGEKAQEKGEHADKIFSPSSSDINNATAKDLAERVKKLGHLYPEEAREILAALKPGEFFWQQYHYPGSYDYAIVGKNLNGEIVTMCTYAAYIKRYIAHNFGKSGVEEGENLDSGRIYEEAEKMRWEEEITLDKPPEPQ